MLHLRCTRNRKSAAIVAVVALVFLTLASLSALKLKQVIRVEDQLDSNFVSSRDLQHMQEVFIDTPSIFLLLSPEGGGSFSSAQLCQIHKGLDLASHQSLKVRTSFGPFDARRAHFEYGKLWYPTLLGDVCQGSVNLDQFRNSLWKGVLTDRNGRDLGFELSVDPLEPPGRLGSVDPDAIPSFRKLLDPILKNAGVKAEWTGPAMRDFYMMVGVNSSIF